MLRFDHLIGLGLAGLVFAAACGGGSGGTSSSSSSSSGGGGSDPTCTSDAQCGASDPCKTVACVEGACVETQAPQGTIVLDGLVPGDCKRRQCAADGRIEEIVDATDKPDDHNPCTVDACTDGAPSHATDPAMEGAQCGSSGQITCAGGVCVGCNNAGQCPAGGPCDKATCNPMGATNACGLVLDVGKEASNIDPGDCLRAVCDMNGLIVPAPAPLEIATPDANECDVESCSESGTVLHAPQPDGTLCGGSTVCKPSACAAGACAQGPLPGMDVASETQVPGDCKRTVCNGAGGTVDQADDTDVPADPTPSDCTISVCSGGVPSTGPAPAGTACVGGLVNQCDGNGGCN
jgi:hypothetical protein